jgi:hypothetical protein
MRTGRRLRFASVALLVFYAALPFDLSAQSASASLEFLVRASPTVGRPEKVMRQPFYLLRKSLADIESEARAEIPPPDLGEFVDALEVSLELKAWMKEKKRTQLRGTDFLAALTPDDVMGVPEFRQAYVVANQKMVGLGFPRHRGRARDRERDPEKWNLADKRYWEEVRAYLLQHPESKEGLDEQLLDFNPGQDWQARADRHEQVIRQRVLQLVHSRYLAAQTETNYEGAARMGPLPPGRYWLTTLWNEVRAGDVRLRWEVPLELKAGENAYLELNNGNALLPPPR